MTHCTTSALLTTPEKVPARIAPHEGTPATRSGTFFGRPGAFLTSLFDLTAPLRFRAVAQGGSAWLNEGQIAALREEYHRTWFKANRLEKQAQSQPSNVQTATSRPSVATRTSASPRYSRLRSAS